MVHQCLYDEIQVLLDSCDAIYDSQSELGRRIERLEWFINFVSAKMYRRMYRK
jgi:hypothetical protein